MRVHTIRRLALYKYIHGLSLWLLPSQALQEAIYRLSDVLVGERYESNYPNDKIFKLFLRWRKETSKRE